MIPTSGTMVGANSKGLFFDNGNYAVVEFSDAVNPPVKLWWRKRAFSNPVTWKDLFCYQEDQLGEMAASDGTRPGTIRLFDLGGPSFASHPMHLVPVGNLLFFTADVFLSYGREPWVTDGTPSGTKLLGDIRKGSFSGITSGPSELDHFARDGNRVFFLAEDETRGQELHVADLAKSEVKFVADIATGAPSCSGRHLTSTSTGLFLSAEDLPGNRRPWYVEYQTFKAQEVFLLTNEQRTVGSKPTLLGRWGGRAFVAADDGVHGRELWSVTGDPDSAVLCGDLTPGGMGSDPRGIGSLGSAFLVVATSAKGNLVVWRTDGTVPGTSLVADLGPGKPEDVVQAASTMTRVCFIVDRHGDMQLWGSDGTGAGTGKILDLPTDDYHVPLATATSIGERFLFPIGYIDKSGYGMRIISTDGTSVGTTQLMKSVAFDARLWKTTEQTMALHGGRAWWVANDGSGIALWSSDGTSTGTRKEIAIAGGDPWQSGTPIVEAGGRLFFCVDGQGTGRELWVSDGTVSGTSLVIDLVPGPSGSDPLIVGRVGDRVLFHARAGGSTPTGPGGFYVSDGTAKGTTFLIEGGVVPTLPRAAAPGLAEHGSRLGWFLVESGATEQEQHVSCFETDGTPAGTAMLRGLRASSDDRVSRPLMLDGFLLFEADDGVHGRELYPGPRRDLHRGAHGVRRSLAGPDPGCG
ncbi:MAG: hypothetical protein R3F30_10470 [Planctomycetota bacterium]